MRAAVLIGLVVACATAGCAATDTPDPADAGRGPLEEYLGYYGFATTPEELLAQVVWQQEHIAACMAKEGFEFTPQVPPLDAIEYEGLDPTEPGFAEEYGYGFWLGPREGVGGGFTYLTEVDVNLQRRDAMSDVEREAYDTALQGHVVEEDASGTVVREGGCLDRLYDPAGPDAAYLAGVRDEARAFLEAMPDDARFDDLNAAWAACMAEAGYAYASPDAARAEFADEVAAEAADGVWPEREVIQERAGRERRVAVADRACQEEMDWQERHQAIAVELQQEYVDAHRADLDALAAAMDPPAADG